MKNTVKTILFLIFLHASMSMHAQIGINTEHPEHSAALDVYSTDQGLLLPRMTDLQRDAIESPATGLIIFCNNCGQNGQFQFYNGDQWKSLMEETVENKK